MNTIKFGAPTAFNLGSALAFAQSLPAGVYGPNGRYFHWDNVRKNKQTGVLRR
jgi:L-asparaginase